jgi:PleD family two-component response regulator
MKDQRVTTSAGLAVHRQEESLDNLIARADKALYKSKAAGKNCLSHG